MEDAHIGKIDITNEVSIFGVFDGHGGKKKLIFFFFFYYY